MFALFKNMHKLRKVQFSSNNFRIVRELGSVIRKESVQYFNLTNEPILTYLKGSKERTELENALKEMASKEHEVPIVIGDREIRTSELKKQFMPHKHQQLLATFYYANKEMIKDAIRTSVEMQKKWDQTLLCHRVKIWLDAADLMAGKYRQELNAATMLGQGKTVMQAEIDSAAELVDFMRINAYYLNESIKDQPVSENIAVTKNSIRHRGFDGFVAAISPFNFTAIGGNLAYTPALMGNGVVWKPSDTSILSNYIIFKIMLEAGVPPGVVNFVPSNGPLFGDTVTNSPFLSGINFTGSLPTFQNLWKLVGKNINKYHNFPRLIGECGGKNFHFVHPGADIDTVTSLTLRSAFEYSGQKCSACSRAYVPESLWDNFKECLIEKHKTLKVGDVQDFEVFTSAVIDEKAFKRVMKYIDMARSGKNLEIIAGGKSDKKEGYFVDPTIIVSKDPLHPLMVEEIFGPVLTIYIYKDTDIEQTMELVISSTPFALTGAVFGKDMGFLNNAQDVFRMAAGNFYINDKSTGAIVGQQPFGGGRCSGTNDKAGWKSYILRWSTLQSIKETFVPMNDLHYPYMSKE